MLKYLGSFSLLLLGSKMRFFKVKCRLWKKIDPVTWTKFASFEYKWNWKVCHALLHNCQEQFFTRLNRINKRFQKLSVFSSNLNQVSQFHCSSYERMPCIRRESTFEPSSSKIITHKQGLNSPNFIWGFLM